MTRKIRMGMVGGGEGAFIGAIHRIAAAMDGQIELVCGAFSSKPEVSAATGRALYLDPGRCYPDYGAMMATEAALPSERRMDFVAVVTPNHLHFPVARLALQSGFHVLSDKPATLTLAQALELRDLVAASGLLYGLTHTYTGYPMVKEARARVAAGELGAIRKVLVEYPQGWLSLPEERSGIRQAQWRLDPARAGASGCFGDIGVHAANLVEYVTGLRIVEVCADLAAVVPGRALDDDGTVLLRLERGARGVLIASQICAGEENNLNIRVYGERGGLQWQHADANTLQLKWLDRPTQLLRSGGPGTGAAVQANTRAPAGHPEGYLEAFANHYRNFAEQIRAGLEQRSCAGTALDVPGIEEAVRGMAFIEAVVSASRSDAKWHPLPRP